MRYRCAAGVTLRLGVAMARVGGRRFRFHAVALWLCLGAATSPAVAVDVQSLIGDLCEYHVLDSDTCSAQALVDCLVQSGGDTGAMQQCAAQHDPEAQKFIAIYAAATKPDYVRLIELAGPVVACKLLPPGPPTEVLCSTAIRPIVEQAFGKAAKLYDAAGKGDWLTVIYLIGDPAIACAVVPSFPGKGVVCGALAQTLMAGAKLLKQGAQAGIKALESGVETLGNVAISGLQSLGLGGAGVDPVTTFEHNQVRPLLHQRALKGLTSAGKPFLGLEPPMLQSCLSIASMRPLGQPPSEYDVKRCESLSQRLHDEATALANLARVAPDAYFGNVKASASLLLATNFWDQKADKFMAAMAWFQSPEEVATGIKPLAVQHWSVEGFQTLPSPFSAVLVSCYENTRATFPVPLAPQLTGALHPPSLWGWVCASAGSRLALAMRAERKRVLQQVIPILTGTGCTLAKTGDSSLKFDCDQAPALLACHALLPDANLGSRCRRSANYRLPEAARARRLDQPQAEMRAPHSAQDVAAQPVLAEPPRRLSAAVASALALRTIGIEAESLLQANAVRAAAGGVDAQAMDGFGTGWSGNAQLFWHGGEVGAVLDLQIEVPHDGAWEVEIALTQAPDYAQLAFEVDQHRAAATFDGYAPRVVGPVTVRLGTFAMRHGLRPRALMITGRHEASTGFLVGIDRVLLRPAEN